MKQKFLLLFCVFFCLHLSIIAQIPTTNLKLWLRADSGVVLNNGAVETWQDVSGSGNHASQSNSTFQPIFFESTLHGKPALRFNGINKFLNGTQIPNIHNSSLSIFVVANGNVYIGNYIATFFGINFYPNQFGFGRSSINQCLIATNTSFYDNGLKSSNNSLQNAGFSYKIFEYTKNFNVISRLYVNGILQNSTFNAGQVGPFFNGNYYIGYGSLSNYLDFYNGDIAEIILYNDFISESDRIAVENYLMNKYAPPVDLGTIINIDYGFCPFKLGVSPDYNSVLWSTGSNADTIIVHQTGYYSVMVTDIFNRISYDTIYVEFPVFNFPDATICLNDSTDYAFSLPGTYSYLWSDFSTDSILTIAQAGTYWLKVTDTLGCFRTDTFTVTVDSFANTVTLGNDTSLCSGNTLQLISGQDQAISYLWFPGNETTSSVQIDTSGWYGVQVENSNGCIGSDSIYVTIVGTAPTPAFQYGYLCFGDSTQFIDLSTPQADIAQRTWIFNNSDTLFGQTVHYVFPDTGYQSVTLFVQDSALCSAVTTAGIEILPVPQVQITYFPVCTNVPATFHGNPVIPAGASVLQYQWLINGILAGNEDELVWNFSATGNVEVQFTVFLDNGCQSTDLKTVQVFDAYPQPGAFEIYNPANNSSFGEFNLTVYWNISNNALFYKLIMASDSLFGNIISEKDSIFNTNAQIEFPDNGTYFFKIIAFNPCLDSTESNIIKVKIFSPASLPNLKLWLRADSGVVLNNENVLLWNDLSGKENHASQSIVNSQPKLRKNVINGNPVIRFDGINDFLSGTSISNINTSSLSVFILANGLEYNGSQISTFFGINFYPNQFGIGRSSTNQALIATNTSFYWDALLSASNTLPNSGFTYRIIEYLKDFNVISRIYLNGDLQNSIISSSQIGAFTNGNYYIGYGNTSNYLDFHSGDIAEIIIFDTILNETNRLIIEQYLLDKYAPPVNLGANRIIEYGFCPIKLGVCPSYSSVLWSTGSTEDTITINQTGYYSVQTVDFAGRLSTDTVYVQFPHFGFSDAINCLGDSTEYISVMPGPYQYLWSDLSTNENLFIKQAGIYWLKLTDTLGCSFTDTFFVAVDSFAVMASLGPDMTVCSGESISLVSGDQPVDYLWSTTETTPSIVVQTDGMYALTVTNINECVAVDTLNILISGVKPDVGFVADSVCFGYPTSFTDTSSATAPDALAFWEWNFNGTTATAQHPQFQFAEPGIHSVQLYVETDSGCTATTVQNIFVIPNPQPAFIPAKGCSGQPIQFTNQTTLGYGNIIGYEWQAKDSLGNVIGVSAATHANFTFPQPGMYHVTLAAITADGCRDSVTRTVEIRRSPPVDFTWSNICIGQITSFTETTQVPPQEMIVERFWDFGDNIYSVLTNPLHYFQNTGTYNVSLFNRSLNGCENTVVKQVSIRQLPVAGLDYSLPCLNTPVEFVSTSTVIDGTIDRVIWTFPNGDTTSLWNPVYAFPDTGNYMISLVAVSNHGCIDSTKQTVTIHPYPEAAFMFSPEYGVPPLDVSFTNLSTGASSYFWNFGDNTFSTAVNPVHTYQETSVYSVLLIAVNTFLCSDSIFGTVYVIPSTYDIAVVAAEQTVSAQLVQSSVKVKNLGNRIVRKLLMKYQIDFGTTVTEQWQGILMPGQETWFTFSSLIDEADLAGRKVICYSVLPDEDVVDANPQNNTSCRVLDPGFYIMSVAPNPANNLITIHLVLKTEGQYNFEMLANDGRMAIERSGLQGSAGINVLEVDVSALQQGVYLIRISNESDKDLRRVMIVR